MRRRDFIAGLGAAVWPPVARAQQASMPVVGLVSLAAADVFAGDMRAFHNGLGDAGYVEGQNVLIEYHWLGGQSGGVPALMADLVRRRVAAIATRDDGGHERQCDRLMSYGTNNNNADRFRQLASMSAKFSTAPSRPTSRSCGWTDRKSVV